VRLGVFGVGISLALRSHVAVSEEPEFRVLGKTKRKGESFDPEVVSL
jgi:hypothetical protein